MGIFSQTITSLDRTAMWCKRDVTPCLGISRSLWHSESAASKFTDAQRCRSCSVMKPPEFTQRWHLTGFIYSLSPAFIRNDSAALLSTSDESTCHSLENPHHHHGSRLLIAQPGRRRKCLDKDVGSGFETVHSARLVFVSPLSRRNIIRLLSLISISPPVGILPQSHRSHFQSAPLLFFKQAHLWRPQIPALHLRTKWSHKSLLYTYHAN